MEGGAAAGTGYRDVWKRVTAVSRSKVKETENQGENCDSESNVINLIFNNYWLVKGVSSKSTFRHHFKAEKSLPFCGFLFYYGHFNYREASSFL